MTDPLVRRHPAGPAKATPSGDRIVTFFQPFYNLRNNRLQGLEALARRVRIDGRTQPPSGFFADAAAEGRMRAIDLQILDDAMARMASWHRERGRTDLILSVNLSWDLVGHRTFVNAVTDALCRHGLSPDRLLVDISTETFRWLRSVDADSLDRLRRLQQREITFCLDGFTAADLEILPDAVAAPVDIIKLHPAQLAPGEEHRRELCEISQQIHEAGLPMVAAGVETDEQLDLVRDLGYEWAQGFLLGEPVEADRALDRPADLPVR